MTGQGRVKFEEQPKRKQTIQVDSGLAEIILIDFDARLKAFQDRADILQTQT